MNGDVRPGSRSDPAATLNRRSVVGLTLVGVLVLLNQAVVLPPLVRSRADVPRINIAGRQRMLSQRLAKEALALPFSRSLSEQSSRRKYLRKVLETWETSHRALRNDATANRAGRDEALASAFEHIEPHYQRMRDAASRLVTQGANYRTREPIEAILMSEPAFLEGMERIVDLYELRARQRIDRLIVTTWIVTGFVLVVLAAIGRLVLQPAAQVIDRQFSELRDARDALEDRVQERTAELGREIQERSKIEQRQRALVEQFSHVARTTSIGEMASGLAHELNQPLGAIANYAEGCLASFENPEPPIDEIRTALEKILSTTLRAGAIVSRIHRFVTRRAPVRESYEPERLVREVEEFFRSEAQRRGVALSVAVAPEMPLCWGDPVQIQQVLINLVRNALDALSGAQVLNPSVVMAVMPVGSRDVEFSVTDNGEGIPQDQIVRVFDAYFSTRDEGMGMGLAISRTIAEGHQGRIGADSQVGAGTTFRLTLPVSGGEDERADGLRG